MFFLKFTNGSKNALAVQPRNDHVQPANAYEKGMQSLKLPQTVAPDNDSLKIFNFGYFRDASRCMCYRAATCIHAMAPEF